jgi:hypothetical protein
MRLQPALRNGYGNSVRVRDRLVMRLRAAKLDPARVDGARNEPGEVARRLRIDRRRHDAG